MAVLRHGAAPSTTAASTPTPTEARLQSGSGGGRLRSGPVADLDGATSTYSDSRRLLLPLCVADCLLLPRRLDLGLAGSDPFEDFFYFLKLIFGIDRQQPILKRDYFSYRRNGIGWLNRYL
jgi:hypothetical protein